MVIVREEYIGEEVLYNFPFCCGEFECEELDEFIDYKIAELDDVCRKLESGRFSGCYKYFQVSRFDPTQDNQIGEVLWTINADCNLLNNPTERIETFRKQYRKMFSGIREILANSNGPINVVLYVKAWREAIQIPPEDEGINIFGERVVDA